MAKLVKRKVIEETYEVPIEDDELDEVENDDEEDDDSVPDEKPARGAKKAGRARSR